MFDLLSSCVPFCIFHFALFTLHFTFCSLPPASPHHLPGRGDLAPTYSLIFSICKKGKVQLFFPFCIFHFALFILHFTFCLLPPAYYLFTAIATLFSCPLLTASCRLLTVYCLLVFYCHCYCHCHCHFPSANCY